MNTMAKGENIYCYWDMQGRINVDLMQVIKDDMQPEDNSLKTAAKTYLKEDQEKIDLSAKEMFNKFRHGNLHDKFLIAEYCARDCDIPLLLISKLSYLPTWIELSRVSITSIHEIINSGQQVRVLNLISKFIYGEYVLNNEKSGWPSIRNGNEWEESEYQGATVIEPISGFYPKNCVITMDFESLYPSIIRYFNLCPSTIILDTVNTVNIKNENKEVHTINHGTFEKSYSFINSIEGVIPKLLKHLISARKAVKKIMAVEKNSFTKELLNGRQNGLKKVCNSVYGFFGVNEQSGVYPCKPIAAVTTLKGRAFIEATKTYVETNYPGCIVIYGDTDSVMIKCPEDVKLQEANLLGEKLSIEITNKLQNGEISLGGAGKMFREQHQNENVNEKQNKRILEACSAMNLAFEKVYFPYLLLKKKRYAGMKHIGNKVTMEMKGIDCIRRDRPKLLRDISQDILNTILLKNCENTQQAKGMLENYLKKIVEKELNLDSYILSKSLKANYASDNLPHVGAFKRMQERGEETPPIGTRIHFIVTKSDKEKLYDYYKKQQSPIQIIKDHIDILLSESTTDNSGNNDPPPGMYI